MSNINAGSRIRTLTKIAILGAAATLLMALEFPLFFTPSFYKFELSETVVLIGAFALGPWAAIAIEFVKIVLNFVIDGTVTAGIGELSNFLIGCALVVPAGLIYRKNKTKKSALVACVAGVAAMVLASAALNYFVLLPTYAAAFGMPIEAIVGMASAVNPAINDLFGLIMLATVPFNLVKGAASALVTMLLYKKVSPILHK